jgi:hypothetical protein
MVLNKQSTSGEYNRLVSTDAFFKLGSSFQVIGNAAKVFSSEHTSRDMAGEFKVNYLKSSFSWRNSYLHIDPGFQPEMGFVRRDDIKEYRSSMWSTRWFNNRYLRDIEIGGFGSYMTDTDNEFISYYGGGRLEMTLGSGDSMRLMAWQESEKIYEEFDIRDILYVDTGTYHSLMREIEFESDESRMLSAGISLSQDDYWGGDRKGLQLFNGVRPFANLNFELFYTYNKIVHPTAEFNTNVLSNRITYSFNTNLFAKSYVQWNELDKRISTNFLVNYRYRPGSDFYLVYNELWDSPEERPGIDISDRVLLLKFTYWFRM